MRAEIALSFALAVAIALLVEGTAALFPEHARAVRLLLSGLAILALCGVDLVRTIVWHGLYSLTQDSTTATPAAPAPTTDTPTDHG